MVTMEASVDEEVVPYLEYFAGILGSFEAAVDSSLRAYFTSLRSNESTTSQRFDAMLIEERDRVVGAMLARGDDDAEGDMVFTIELKDELEEMVQDHITTSRVVMDEILHTAILSLSVIEDILETDPDSFFTVDGHNLPFRLFLQEAPIERAKLN